MADTVRVLRCFFQGDSMSCKVTAPGNADVGDVKDLIFEKGTNGLAHAMEMVLWKLSIPVPISPPQDLAQRILSQDLLHDAVKLEDVSELVLDLFPAEPPTTSIHIIVESRHSTTMTPSGTDLSPNVSWTEFPWLYEIHAKLWGRRDLVASIFRKANLTETDFTELQNTLELLNPSRSSTAYTAVKDLASKAAFLHARSSVDNDAVSYFATCDADCNLVPQPFVGLLNQDDDATDQDDNTTDTDAEDDGMDTSSDSGSTTAAEGCTGVFPYTVRYIDLTFLQLEQRWRVPHLLFIRDDWGFMINLFNKREKGIDGGGAFTGQPGIGKTCMLYYILILCLIRAKPFLFQNPSGRVRYINNEVQDEFTTAGIPGRDVLALVDADGRVCVPHPRLFENNFRVLLVSSPRTKQDRKWLVWDVNDEDAVFIVKPWSRKDFFVMMLFLSPVDITLERLQDVTRICGYNPRQCGRASASPDALQHASRKIINAIKDTKYLSEAINNVIGGQPIHRAFEVWPSPDGRTWEDYVARPISPWALSQMVAELDRRDANAAYTFYRLVKGSRNSASLSGQLFEFKVHKFLQSITEPRSFSIRSLDDPSITFNIEFSSNIVFRTFGADQFFTGHLITSVKNQESCYLKPLSPVFSAFDAFLYQHTMARPGYQPFMGVQVTNARSRSVSIKGLEGTQRALKKYIPELKDLRPIKAKKWIILFIVPEPMAVSFQKQIIKDSAKVDHWDSKTAQFVLGLPEQEVLRSC